MTWFLFSQEGDSKFYNSEVKSVLDYVKLLLLSFREVRDSFSCSRETLRQMIRDRRADIAKECELASEISIRMNKIFSCPKKALHAAISREFNITQNDIIEIAISLNFITEETTSISNLLNMQTIKLRKGIIDIVASYIQDKVLLEMQKVENILDLGNY